MSRLPTHKNIQIENFPSEHKKWVSLLLGPVNQFFGVIYSALNGNLEFGINIKSQIFEFTHDVDNGELPIKFQSNIGRPQGVVILKVANLTDETTLTVAPFIEWDFIQNQVRLNNIIGLPAGKKFQISILII